MSQALRRSLSREQFHVAWLAASGYFQLNQKPYSQTESLQKETCIAVHVCREHPRPTSSKPSGCDPFCPGRCCTEVRGERLNWVCPKIRHAFQTKGPTRNTQTQSLASEGCWRDSSPKARISLAASRHRSHALQSVVQVGAGITNQVSPCTANCTLHAHKGTACWHLPRSRALPWPCLTVAAPAISCILPA